MGKEPKASSASGRSFFRLLFWEGMGAAGFIHMLNNPLADSFLAMNFFYNALFFLTAYPLLYVYRWKLAGGCLGSILWPLSFVLGVGLGVSAYLWTAYLLYFTAFPYFQMMVHHWFVLGLLFLFVYFPLIQPFWGVGKGYHSAGRLFWIALCAALGGLLGYLLGQFVTDKFDHSLGSDNSRFLLWLSLILLGSAAGALGAGRNAKE